MLRTVATLLIPTLVAGVYTEALAQDKSKTAELVWRSKPKSVEVTEQKKLRTYFHLSDKPVRLVAKGPGRLLISLRSPNPGASVVVRTVVDNRRRRRQLSKRADKSSYISKNKQKLGYAEVFLFEIDEESVNVSLEVVSGKKALANVRLLPPLNKSISQLPIVPVIKRKKPNTTNPPSGLALVPPVNKPEPTSKIAEPKKELAQVGSSAKPKTKQAIKAEPQVPQRDTLVNSAETSQSVEAKPQAVNSQIDKNKCCNRGISISVFGGAQINNWTKAFGPTFQLTTSIPLWKRLNLGVNVAGAFSSSQSNRPGDGAPVEVTRSTWSAGADLGLAIVESSWYQLWVLGGGGLLVGQVDRSDEFRTESDDVFGFFGYASSQLVGPTIFFGKPLVRANFRLGVSQSDAIGLGVSDRDMAFALMLGWKFFLTGANR